MKKYMLIILPLIAGACAAKSGNEAEAYMFKSVPAARSNDYNTPFLAAAAGNYTNVNGTEFRVAPNGDFTLDNISYSMHEVLSEKHAIFKAETPIPGKNQKMITYHGIIVQTNELLTSGVKKDLDFTKAPKFSPEDTPYATVLNAQRIENLDFDIAKATRFAVKVD